MVSSNPPKYALITGATSGIGYELAKLFAEDGYNLVIVARTETDLQRTAAEFSSRYGVTVIPIAKIFLSEPRHLKSTTTFASKVFVLMYW